MGAIIELARISLRLRREGILDQFVPTLVTAYREEHPATVPPWYVQRNLPAIATTVYKMEPEISQHLVTESYNPKMVFRVHYSAYLKSMGPHSEEYKLAREFLPIGHASGGIRYVPHKRHDYLYSIYLILIAKSADAKEYARCVKEIQAFRNGHLPEAVLKCITNQHILTIPEAINGTEGLPFNVKKPLGEIQKKIRELPKAWGDNFNR